MTSASFDLDEPDHFTMGTVGPVGQRTFYLQGRQEAQVVTLKAEKEQMAALAEYLAELLEKLHGLTVAEALEASLLEPIEPVWAVGSIGVGYDEARDRIVVVATEALEEGADEDAASARFALTREQTAAFVERARKVVSEGRPICPMCSAPKDPGGHVCPRSNGHILTSSAS